MFEKVDSSNKQKIAQIVTMHKNISEDTWYDLFPAALFL